jgi:hypothetical protein
VYVLVGVRYRDGYLACFGVDGLLKANERGEVNAHDT